MNTGSPDCARSDEQLLEYAYGELSPEPRAELERHLPGCTRCQAELAALRSTRRAMAALAPEPAPDAGLASLLAYAEQQAKRHARPSRPRWMGWLLGAVPTAAAVVIIATVAMHMRNAPLAGVAAEQEEAPNAIPAAAVAPAAPEPEPMPERLAELGEPKADAFAGHAGERKRQIAAKPSPKPEMAERQRAANLGGFASGPALAEGGRSMGGAAKDAKLSPARSDLATKKAAEDFAGDKNELAQAPAPPTSAAPQSVAPAEAMAAPRAPAASRGMAAPLDALAQAAALGRQGHHRAAAEAYRSIYAADPTGPSASEALFAAASEEQAAGELAAAARDFEAYALAFASKSNAPAALARAAEIRRSQEGEGAATALEQDLLQRYPDSPEARGLRARTSRVETEKHARKASAPALDAAEPAPATQPAAAAPAQSR